MAKTETKCFLCGSAVAADRSKVTLQDRFATVVKIALLVSAAMTCGSLFVDIGLSFTKCIITTIVLGLVMKSARMMKENA